jgi:hypothetical protein
MKASSRVHYLKRSQSSVSQCAARRVLPLHRSRLWLMHLSTRCMMLVQVLLAGRLTRWGHRARMKS